MSDLPPIPLPPGRVVAVPGSGEMFVRDTGGDGPPVLLLHGWTASADLNWIRQYDALADAGYRVLAVDHRGHGRGPRGHEHFRLSGCAEDAVNLLTTLGVGPAILVGYSMGGPIAQLAARTRPEMVSGMVLCATSSNWRSPRLWLLWRSMVIVRLLLGLAPEATWRRGVQAIGLSAEGAEWAAAELARGSARDIAEAGRELGRYDARPWLRTLRVPAAVVLTRRDDAVPPPWQRDLARRLDAPIFESPGDHFACTQRAPEFNAALLAALERVAGYAAPGESAPGAVAA